MNMLSRTTSILAAVALFALPACGGDAGTKTDNKTKAVAKTDPNKPDVKADVKTDDKTDVKADDKTAEPDTKADPNAEKVQLAATIAKEISGAPDKADEILGKHGLDREKLDAMMFEIAGDRELTEAYMAARRDS